MSRYRRTDDDLAYGDLPAPDRWDSSRFARESQNRRAPVIEARPPYESSRRAEPSYDERQYYEDDFRSGPRGSREQRRFYEEDDYYDPRTNSGAMIPFRPERPARPAAPPRPRMLRRQSSVDRIDFDRGRNYDDYRAPPPPPPRENRGSRYDIRIYDDVRVQDPDTYGDDGFREYREREWTRSRTRNDEPSPDRRAPTRVSVASRSEFVDAAPLEAYEERVVEKATIVEKPYPRRGKTKMPKRLVHTKVLFELGYPFYELDEKTILIEKALGPDNIDEVFARSKEYREREVTVTTTKLLEAGPASLISPSHKPISEAPRSVREWDNFDRSPSPGSSVSQATRKSRRSRSQATRRNSVHESKHESIHERTSRDIGSVHESIHEDIHRDTRRSISPAPTGRSFRSRRAKSRTRTRRGSSSDSATTIMEKRTVIEERAPVRARSRRGSRGGTEFIERRIYEKEEIEESNSLGIGPLALVPKSRTEEDIRDEIRRLELERRDIRRDTDIIRYDRRTRVDTSPIGALREASPRGEIIITDKRSDDVVAVRKDKRARSKSRPPTSGLLKAMMFTTT